MGRLTDDLRLAGSVLRTPVVGPTSANRAVAGLQLLRSLRMTLDLEGRRLRLERPDAVPIDSPPVRGLGAGFRRHGPTWQVAYVIESGPAERAGLRVGDRVSSLDGTAVAEIPAGPIDARLEGRESVVLQIDSGDVPRAITIPIKTFVDGCAE